MVRQIILAGFVVFLPAGLGAQGRGAMPSVSRAVTVAPRAVVPAPHAMTAQAVAGTRTVVSGGALRPKTVVPGVRGRRPQLTARRRIDDPMVSAKTASSAPLDNEEFVFVRRDGTLFFAVAYSWEKGTLHYITSQGLPRTITEDTLDLDATRQFNEQRGLSFRLPA